VWPAWRYAREEIVRLSIPWLVLVGVVSTAAMASEPEDPYLWLEEVEGSRAVAWVKAHNAATLATLTKVREYKPIFQQALAILDSEEKLVVPRLIASQVYNFWQDKAHVRGIWRRTDLPSFRAGKAVWETVIDVDALAAAEGVPWVFKGATCLEPENRLCMVALSRGGSDAAVYREFDLAARSFVAGGFTVAEAKSAVSWKDGDTLWVATDFGEGSRTRAGYPRVVKEWRRGTPIESARTVFEGSPNDVGVWPATVVTPEGVYHLVTRVPAFYLADLYLELGGRLVLLAVPRDAEFKGIFRDHLLVSLRSDWGVGERVYREGSLLAVPLDSLLRNAPTPSPLFEPEARSSLDEVATTRDRVLFTILDNVRSRLFRVAYSGGEWRRSEVALPGVGTAAVVTTSDQGDLFAVTYEDFLTPRTLFLGAGDTLERIQAEPSFFDASGMSVAQHEATSKDGTKIPYFLVTPKGFRADGRAPTLLYGYGGFEVAEVPHFSAITGSAWLARGGVYVLANLRGGGEFGPAWHKAALKEHRLKAFEDFIAVAEDLIARRITAPAHLGIMGGSQGGLLVAGTMTLRPDLFGAVVSQVPLTDMRRYHLLLAGASWMGEYGNPDVPEEWQSIQAWSPYHQLRRDVRYPKAFFWTTTRDDRVHPAHARKMVAKMEAYGHPVFYFEQIEGGHGSGSVNAQRAAIRALEFAYLWTMLR